MSASVSATSLKPAPYNGGRKRRSGKNQKGGNAGGAPIPSGMSADFLSNAPPAASVGSGSGSGSGSGTYNQDAMGGGSEKPMVGGKRKSSKKSRKGKRKGKKSRRSFLW